MYLYNVQAHYEQHYLHVRIAGNRDRLVLIKNETGYIVFLASLMHRITSFWKREREKKEAEGEKARVKEGKEGREGEKKTERNK